MCISLLMTILILVPHRMTVIAFPCIIYKQDMATYVKKKCDEEFGGTWHCCFGRNFGCSITHDTKYVLFFQVELMHVLLFKSLE